MTPSIKKINVGERLELSHVDVKKKCAIVYFKNCPDKLVILDRFTVMMLKRKPVRGVEWASELEDIRRRSCWYKVEIECYNHQPITTICLRMCERQQWVWGFDPYTRFTDIVYKNISASLIV